MINQGYGIIQFRLEAYSSPANQPASLPGHDMNTSNMWSAEHAILDTAEGLVLIHGGFSPNRSFIFDPTTVTWAQYKILPKIDFIQQL